MKTKEIILKESPNTDEETLEHCLTAIQAMLDMDDFERAYNYLNGFVSEIIAQTREETIREALEELPELIGGTTPDQIAYESGYSFCRTTILNKLKK